MANQIFRWKHSNVFISLCWGMAGVMLGIAVAIEQRDLWFALAYLFSIAATVWSIGAWLTSDFLSKKDPAHWNRQRRGRAKRSDWRILNYWRYSGIFAFILLLAGVFVVTRSLQIQLYLNDYHGKLYPRNEPIPDNACSRLQGDYLLVFLGKRVGAIDRFPRTVIRRLGTDILAIDKHDDGSMAVSLDVRSDDGKIIAQLKRGQFIINRNNILSKDRPDQSLLRVVDQNGTTVLDLDYFNPRAMKLHFVTNGLSVFGKYENDHTCYGTSPGGPPPDSRNRPIWDIEM